MGVLTGDAIRAAKPKTTIVPAEAWGGDICIRKLSAPTRLRLAGKYTGELTDEQQFHFAVDALLESICDDTGSLLFDPQSEADFAELAGKEYDCLSGIFAEVLKFNGMTKQALEDAEKKSESSPS